MRPRHCLLAGGLGLAFGAALWTGWLTSPQSWQRTTGWSAIPVSERPTQGPLWAADTVAPPPKIIWLGHAGFVIEWGGRRLVVDPNASPRCTVAKRVMKRGPILGGNDSLDLGPVDAVLISHAHYDHLDLPTLRRLDNLVTVVVPAGSEHYLSALENEASLAILGLSVGASTSLGPIEIIAVPAQHNGNRFHPLASEELALGYVLRLDGEALYIAGDTGFGSGAEFRALAQTFRPRAAILPIGAFAPRWPLAHFHLSPEEAVEAARILGVETVVPSHFGTFTLSLDRPAWALPRFARAAAAARIAWRMPPLLGSSGDLRSQL